MKKKRNFKKFLASLLAFAVLVTSIPLSSALGIVDSAYAAESGRLSETNLTDYAFKSNKYMEIYYPDYEKMQVKVGSCTEAGMQMKMFTIDGFLVFCNEHGVTQKSVKLKRIPAKNALFYNVYWDEGDKYRDALNNMFAILMFGPVDGSSMSELYDDLGFKDSKFYGQNGTGYTKGAWVAATQMLLWESQQLMRNDKFERVSNGLHYQTGYHGANKGPIDLYHYTKNLKGKPAMDIYNFMAASVKNYKKFDKSIASTEKDKPKEIALNLSDAEKASGKITFPHTETIKASSYAGEYKLVNSKGKAVKGAKITYDKAKKEYSLVIESEEVLGKVLEVKHDNKVAKRAESYLKKSSDYKQYFYEYEVRPSGHTQGFVSGLEDPVSGYLKIGTKTPEIKEGDCTPPDVEIFPDLHFPIEKISNNEGFDGDNHTPEGDAGFDATYTLERNIQGKGWETIQQITLDDMGSLQELYDKPFNSATDLEEFKKESGSITGCSHPITNDKGQVVGYEHNGTKEPKRIDWDVTVEYRITETRPDGRYIDPDKYAGVREYSFTYHAETEDTCTYFCDSLPWTEVQYKFDWNTTLGDGSSHSDGLSQSPQENLSYDTETFVNDNFRGIIQLTKSNEKYDPFKDSGMGGSEMNQSQNSYWSIELVSGGFEGQKYPHLVSETPENLKGINVYRVSRGAGIPNNTINGGLGMKVGTEGKLIIEDVPYGEYLVREVKADDPMYVLEEFAVRVDEHNPNGQKVAGSGLFNGYSDGGTNDAGFTANGTGDYYNNIYSANIRDKVKSNIVKIVKTDSETGKPVRLKGTKVFVRYKGNPDFTEEENIRRYGESGTDVKGIYNRFLPNAEIINSQSTDYVFELDNNGEFIIPYQLPYGRYEVLEWLLPNGYYVGRYGESGKGQSHNFGMIEEGIFKYGDTSISGNEYTGDGHRFEDTVAVFDKDGKKVQFKDKSEYKFDDLKNMITNSYQFEVTKQNTHTDGNFTQLTEYTGKVSEADPSYENSEHPYINKYTITAVLNNAVKGKLEIEKKGEALVGFEKKEKDGHTIFEPVYEMAANLKDAVFGVFAAKDETLNDGSEGPIAYDAQTDDVIKLNLEKQTHYSNILETVTAFLGKLMHPMQYIGKSVYSIKTAHHESGAEIWQMLEREKSEGNVKRTIYLTPEQKDTVYSYVYEDTDSDPLFNFRYDIKVVLKNRAGGQNVTDVNVTKTTTAKMGNAVEIPLTQMEGSVGDTVLSPIENFRAESDPLNWKESSMLEAYNKVYTFEADGELDKYSDGTDYEDGNHILGDGSEVDLSKFAAKRYIVKERTFYTLKAADLKTEEREIEKTVEKAGVDNNGDGDFDDEGEIPPSTEVIKEKVTRAKIEWAVDESGMTLLLEKEAGKKAVFKDSEDNCFAAVTGYYEAGSYTNYVEQGAEYRIEPSDKNGQEVLNYTVPDGWSKEAFTGNPEEDKQHIIITRLNAETGMPEYKVLLSDMINWQDCDEKGNFKQAAVQVYKVTYTQEKNDSNGFTVSYDRFNLSSNVDWETNTAVTVINKQPVQPANENVDLGSGYEFADEGNVITFNTIPITAPIYFLGDDGIRTEMYYKGGYAYTKMIVPSDAVDHEFEDIVPTLNFIHEDADGNESSLKLDWYTPLKPDSPVVEFNNRVGLPNGATVAAKRHDSVETDVKTCYTIEIVTNQSEDKPLEITFADGYKMRIYSAQTANGNGVGVIDLANVYKTNRHPVSELVDTIKADKDGKYYSKLLPLGDYIVRELSSQSEYVNEEEGQFVKLEYKDQFTPLIWGGKTFTNKYFKVEIDLSKVFETAFKSEEYIPPKENQSVTFGLYAAEDIAASAKGSAKLKKTTIHRGEMLDVLTINYNKEGIYPAFETKLPEGRYYLKEIKAPDTHIMSPLRYNFAVMENKGDFSQAVTFDYEKHDGITGKLVMKKKGVVTLSAKIENRYPMPEIEIDGTKYSLTEALENDYVKIEPMADFTSVSVTATNEKPVEVIFHNGKTVKVVPKDNEYEYTIDGKTLTYVPTVTYTGYHALYEEIWKSVKGEDLNTHTVTTALSGAGTEKGFSVNASITHTPSTKVVTEDVLIDPDKPELGYEKVDKVAGNLTPKGYQIFKHTAEITATKDGVNLIPDTFIRINGKHSSEETFDGVSIKLNVKDKVVFTSINGLRVFAEMDKYGNVTTSIEGMQTSAIAAEQVSAVNVTRDGNAADAKCEFAKNVTLARQDTSADYLMIKINSDNKDAFEVENDHKPKVEIEKVDEKDHNKKLSGAVFEIYEAVFTSDWEARPGKCLGEFTTGYDGKAALTLDYGVYFYREVRAPRGYAADLDYVRFRVAKGEEPFVITVENAEVPIEPGNPTPSDEDYLLEIIKVDSENGQSLAGAEFEIYKGKLVDGKYVPEEKPLFEKPLVTGSLGKLTVRLEEAGVYFYREVKAPAGYACDDNFYQVEVGKDSKVVTKVTVENEKIQDKEFLPPEKPEKHEAVKYPKEDEAEEPMVPKTSDKYNLMFYVIAMGAALFAVFCILKKSSDI